MDPLKEIDCEWNNGIDGSVGCIHTLTDIPLCFSQVAFIIAIDKIVPFLLQKRFHNATKWALGPWVLPSPSHHCRYNVGEF